jgi:glycosyltransferase A (GT-A) superfamily protein (DUF2064 family)
VQLVVLADEPRPERMDGRLSPPWTLGQASAVREAALADTLETVAATPASRRVVALDGELLFGAFEDCFHLSNEPVVLIGMDTPQVTTDLLMSVQLLLDSTADAVMGLTPTGGTWLIALRHLHPDAFSSVPASGHDTGEAQLERLTRCGYQVALTERLRELGNVDDAVQLAALRPASRLAAAVDAAVSGRRSRR